MTGRWELGDIAQHENTNHYFRCHPKVEAEATAGFEGNGQFQTRAEQFHSATPTAGMRRTAPRQRDWPRYDSERFDSLYDLGAQSPIPDPFGI